MEALAASRAASFAREHCISKVEFEGDGQRIVTAINNQAPSKSMFGHVIEEIWMLLDIFHEYSFRHKKGGQTSLLIPLLKKKKKMLTL